MLNKLTQEEIDAILTALPTLPRAEQEQILRDLEELERKQQVESAKSDFLAFCHYVYPGFKEGPHHRHMRPLLHGLNEGNQPRLTVSMPPRFGKSESVAYLFVSWYLGHHPDHHIMMVTHTADLSADFGRKVRNMLDSDIYHEVFPDTVVSRDKSAASNWSTTKGGKYLAIGIGANVAGHGAHCLHPNTKIAGAGSLGHLSIGDTVLTKYGRQRVTKKLLTTHPFFYTVNEALVASGNHPVYGQNGWTRVDALKVGDRIETLTVWRKLWERIRLLRNLLTKRGVG